VKDSLPYAVLRWGTAIIPLPARTLTRKWNPDSAPCFVTTSRSSRS